MDDVDASRRTTNVTAGASFADAWTRRACCRACARRRTPSATTTRTAASVARDYTKRTPNVAKNFPPEARAAQISSAQTPTRSAEPALARVNPSSSSCKASADLAAKSLRLVCLRTRAPTTTRSASRDSAPALMDTSCVILSVFRA